jgi:hypothetical protein
MAFIAAARSSYFACQKKVKKMMIPHALPNALEMILL